MQTMRINDTVPKRAEGAGQEKSRKKEKTTMDELMQRGMQWPVTSFIAVVAVLAFCLKGIDQLLFCDDASDDFAASELCAFGAFAVGVCFFLRKERRGPVKPTKAALRPESSAACDSQRIRKLTQRTPGSVGLHSKVVEDADAVAERVNQVMAASKSGSMALAEARLAQLIRSGCLNSLGAVEASNSKVALQQIHAMLQACVEAGDAVRAAAWTLMLLQDGLQPSPRSLQAVMQALVKDKEFTKAQQLLGKVLATSVPVDATCLQLLFKHCISASDIGSIEEVIQKLGGRSQQDLMQGFLAILRSERHASSAANVDYWMNRAIEANVAGSVHVFNAAIHACARLGDTERAEFWLRNMDPLSPDATSYSSIVAAFVQKGDQDGAENWLRQMTTAGLCPDAAGFNTLVKTRAQKDDVGGAERWIKLAIEHGVPFQSLQYNCLLGASVRTGDTARAERWLRRVAEEGLMRPDTSGYNAVVSAYAKQGDSSGAERVVALMCEHNVEPDVVTLGAAVHAAAKSGNQEKAEAMFDLILTRGKTRPDAIGFNALINASVKAGDTRRAEFWLSKMLDVGVEPSVVSYTTVLHAHARKGDIKAAEKGMELMQANGVEANVVSYTALIHACVKVGDIPRAERWFEAMRTAGIHANAVSYSSLLNVCAKAGDYERAERWLEQMHADGVSPTEVCYNNVIDACTKAQRADRAEAWLWRLVESERGLGLAPTRQSFTSASQAYAKQGEYKEVERLMKEMEDRKIEMDEFSLTVQLSAYARARPRQRERAEATMRRYCGRQLPITKPPLRVLKSILSGPRLENLLEELDINVDTLDDSDHRRPNDRRAKRAKAKAAGTLDQA